MSFTKEQLIERQRYLGASEAAASVGLSKWFSKFDLYRSKIGEIEPIEETLPMMVGTALEPVVLSLFEKERKLKVTNQQQVYYDSTLPWRRATVDGIAEDGAVVQAKASGDFTQWGDADDAVPEQYIYQVHHEMACVGASRAYIPVVLSQREFRVYTVERNEGIIQALTAGEIEFMKLVEARTPPPPSTNEDVKFLYPHDIGTVTTATPDIEQAAYSLASLKAQIKALETTEESLGVLIKDFMGVAALLRDSKGKDLFTWKANEENRLDTKAIREFHPEIAERFTKTNTVRKLLCKIKVK